MKKIVVPLFLVLFVISITPAVYAQNNSVDLTELQKKEKERLEKLRKNKKKGKVIDNKALEEVRGTVKFAEKNSILNNDKSYITDKGTITFKDQSITEKIKKQFPEFDKYGRLSQYGNNLQRAIVESGFVSYILTLAIFISLFYLAVMWRLFSKAGYSGILSLIPVVNLYIMVKIAGRSFLFFLLMFIPILNFFVSLIMHIDIAQRFGKSAVYGLGLAFFGFIFYPLLAFGSAEYDDYTVPGY